MTTGVPFPVYAPMGYLMVPFHVYAPMGVLDGTFSRICTYGGTWWYLKEWLWFIGKIRKPIYIFIRVPVVPHYADRPPACWHRYRETPCFDCLPYCTYERTQEHQRERTGTRRSTRGNYRSLMVSNLFIYFWVSKLMIFGNYRSAVRLQADS